VLFSQMDAGAQLSIMAVIAYGVVAALRALGLSTKPGLASVLASVGVAAVTGYAANGWPGALLGVLAGLAATGAHQVGRQTQKVTEDIIEEQGGCAPRGRGVLDYFWERLLPSPPW